MWLTKPWTGMLSHVSATTCLTLLQASTLTKLEHPIAGEDLPPRPRFIWSVRRVADSLPAAKQQEQSNRVFHLLMQLLAPSEHRRLTAADVVQMAWLQDAASSLEPCPVKLSL